MITLDLPDETATAELAARISALAEPGDVIALRGDLGTGKTSFARAFIRAFVRRPSGVFGSSLMTGRRAGLSHHIRKLAWCVSPSSLESGRGWNNRCGRAARLRRSLGPKAAPTNRASPNVPE